MMEVVKKQPRRRRNRRGLVLPLVVAMVVLLSAMGVGLLRLGLGARMRAARTTAEIAARAAADAGFTKAIFEMNKNLDDVVKPWKFNNITSPVNSVLPQTNANYTYTIEEIVKDSEYKITSIGRSGWAKKTVSMAIRRQGLFDYAIFATGYAHPKHPKAPKHLLKRPKPPKKGGKLHIKGYNIESYSSNPKILLSGNLQIRTNSYHKTPIKLEKDIVINGDVVVGPGGKPDKVIKMHEDAQITGDTYAAAEVSELPPVIVPKYLDNQKAKEYEYEPNEPINGHHKYKKLEIPEGAQQEIDGDCTIYVVGDMKLEEGAQLIVTENSSLTLYVGKKLEVKRKKGGIANETEDPTKLIIYGTDTCRKVKLQSAAVDGDFYGAVYAPYAKVEIKNSKDVYGAFVGWDVKLKNKKGKANKTFYFDEALRFCGGNVRFVRAIWHEE